MKLIIYLKRVEKLTRGSKIINTLSIPIPHLPLKKRDKFIASELRSREPNVKSYSIRY